MKRILLFLILFLSISYLSYAENIVFNKKIEVLRRNWKHLSYDLKDIIETSEVLRLEKPQEFLSNKGKPSDKDLEYIFSLKRVVCKDIDIFSGGFNDFFWTKYFPKLEEIDLSCISINSLKGIANPKNIKKLGLGKLRHTEELILLKKCKNLKILRIILDNNSINYMKYLTYLEELNIVYSNKLTTIKPIMMLNLKHLQFGDNNVPEIEILRFKNLHKNCIVEF